MPVSASLPPFCCLSPSACVLSLFLPVSACAQACFFALSLPGSLLSQVSPNVGNERDGHTALHRACAAGHAAVVVALLWGGAVAETAARDGGTALHCAAAAGQVGAIEALLPVLEEGVGEEAGVNMRWLGS
eukprot:scaffold16424_cov107-Isochrysis_galbana.AAC.1